jgi:hypothetical protein
MRLTTLLVIPFRVWFDHVFMMSLTTFLREQSQFRENPLTGTP